MRDTINCTSSSGRSNWRGLSLDEAIRNDIEAIEETYGVSIGLIVTEEK